MPIDLVLQRALAQQRQLKTTLYRNRVRRIAQKLGLDFQFEFKQSGDVEAIWIRDVADRTEPVQSVGPIGRGRDIDELLKNMERDCGL